MGGLGSRADDVCILSECDKGVRELADALSWREELEALWKVVSGKEADGDVAEAPLETRTKDEILEDEIENLTREVEHTLKISNGHKQDLEDHLSKKITKGPSEEPDEITPQGSEDRSGTDGPSTVLATQDLTNHEKVGESKESEAENQRTSESMSSSSQAETVTGNSAIGTDESTSASQGLAESNRANSSITKVDDDKTSNLVDTKSHL